MNLAKKEKITSVVRTSPGDHLGVLTSGGWMVLFDQDNLRPMGKTAGGVKGIALQDKDTVASMFVYKDEPFIMVYSDYAGKLINIEDLKIQKRARK
jgi:DNA gyrase subunit A